GGSALVGPALALFPTLMAWGRFPAKVTRPVRMLQHGFVDDESAGCLRPGSISSPVGHQLVGFMVRGTTHPVHPCPHDGGVAVDYGDPLRRVTPSHRLVRTVNLNPN